jgi:hypothetical protein
MDCASAERSRKIDRAILRAPLFACRRAAIILTPRGRAARQQKFHTLVLPSKLLKYHAVSAVPRREWRKGGNFTAQINPI